MSPDVKVKREWEDTDRYSVMFALYLNYVKCVYAEQIYVIHLQLPTANLDLHIIKRNEFSESTVVTERN